MTAQFTFVDSYRYSDQEPGITLPVILRVGDQFANTTAKVDTGAEFCLFSREIGEKLGLQIESGSPLVMDSLAGKFETYGHEVIIQMRRTAIQSFIYFAKYPGLRRNLLGRQGWLRHLKIAIVDYDSLIYLSLYNS